MNKGIVGIAIGIISLFSSLMASHPPIEWDFPKDYGPHSDYRVEWWYFTGHLTDSVQTQYGFQVTFFRYLLDTIPDAKTPWNSPHLYTAHFSFADPSTQTFTFHEIHSRDFFDQVKTSQNGLDLKVKSWHLRYDEGQFLIDIQTSDSQFKLNLRPTKPVVFHGQNGISYKSSSQQAVTHYYSHTRLQGEGQFSRADQQITFSKASAWMDREIFNQLLAPDQTGWDWFSIQFDNGEELMLFRVRSPNNPFYSGTHIDADGSPTPLTGSDFQLKATRFWTSPDTGSRYPIEWTITRLDNAHEYHLKAVMPNQELSVTYPFPITYWEGQCIVKGSQSGRAYMELVGY